MKKYIVLLRGLPGSGKSTVAELLANKDDLIFSADDFFMIEGKYIFDVDKLHQAHIECQNNVKRAMIDGIAKIFVCNTNTTKKELKSYFDLAKEYEYLIISLIVENRHDSGSIHNVPEETLIKMKNRFDIQL